MYKTAVQQKAIRQFEKKSASRRSAGQGEYTSDSNWRPGYFMRMGFSGIFRDIPGYSEMKTAAQRQNCRSVFERKYAGWSPGPYPPANGPVVEFYIKNPGISHVEMGYSSLALGGWLVCPYHAPTDWLCLTCNGTRLHTMRSRSCTRPA